MSKRFEDEIEDILELAPDLPDGPNLSGLTAPEKIRCLWSYFINREVGILSSRKIILLVAISVGLYLMTRILFFVWVSVLLLAILYSMLVFSFGSFNRMKSRLKKLKNWVLWT